ncbi:MAG TPA: polysaccharide biosynthesis/export family protein [Vicinamibacterales bacterium]|nr:polysaccharide biosynthesis/export family protein [Vicinamibacterales bacterium]
MKSRLAFVLLLVPGAALAGPPVVDTAPPAAQAAVRPAAPPQAPAPGTPAETPGAAATAVTASDYRLGAGDKLRIEVYKEPQLSQSLQVRPDGKITMPLIGDLTAVELTPMELRDRIAAALKEYVMAPVVTVIVVEAVASNVYVMGEVARPGPLSLQGPMTALQAIAMAGGFKDFADTKNVRILRRNKTGVETIRFNYREAVRGNATPIYLRAGDTVIVP